MDSAVEIEPPKTPNLDALSRVSDSISSIMEFLEWAEEERIITIKGGRPFQHAYKFFSLDEKAIEKERCALLDYQRALNTQELP